MTAEQQDDQQPQAPPARTTLVVPALEVGDIPDGDDRKARREASAIANESLEVEAKARVRRVQRREAIRDIVHWLKIAFILIFALGILASLAIVGLHIMTPVSFLTPEQLGTLKTVLTSSLVTGAAGALFKSVQRDLDE
ncbi:hypothetical protein [Luteimonas sp. FCS-9]|uniref:hypothetical protein n=1 Tax=Luteimonas sp. FCS-9 TaxID=1547516 RepID=UPI0012E0A5FF|nr:hypothetical protein [Luteimonas sp. FCS-9]